MPKPKNGMLTHLVFLALWTRLIFCCVFGSDLFPLHVSLVCVSSLLQFIAYFCSLPLLLLCKLSVGLHADKMNLTGLVMPS